MQDSIYAKSVIYLFVYTLDLINTVYNHIA